MRIDYGGARLDFNKTLVCFEEEDVQLSNGA